jgi:hypothetical protein
MSEIPTSHQRPEAPSQRKPYRKPEVLSHERLEALAIVCSPPSKADIINCPSGQITS